MTLKSPMKFMVNKERRFKMTIQYKDMKGLKGGLLKAAFLLLSVSFVMGLSTAVSFSQTSFAIDYLATSRSYTATMQINDKPEDVWQGIVNAAKKMNPDNLKNIKENKKELKFEATKITETGEELWASLKVRPVSETSCRLIFTATMGGGKPLAKAMRDTVTEILLEFCEEEKLTCKIAD